MINWPINLLLITVLILGARKFLGFLLIVAIIVGASGVAIRVVALKHNFLTDNFGPISLIGTVKSEPSPKNSFLVTTQSINSVRIQVPVRISSKRKVSVLIGEKVEIKGESVPSREVRTAGLIFARQIKVISPAKPIFTISENIRKRFRQESSRIDGDAGALVPGLVIGDTKLESESFVAQMRRVGLTHLTAVSGENFAIVAAFIAWALRRLVANLKVRLAFTSVVLILFIFLVRPSPSVIRASVMTAIALIATARGLKVRAEVSLGAAVAILILIDPFQAIDPGFALSVGATAGIILIAPKLKLPEPIAIPIAATIMCTPIIIALSGTLSLISIPANIAAAPLVAPITILGFIAALIPPLAPSLLFIIAPFANLLALIAHFGAGFAVLQLPKSFLGAALVILLFTLFWFKRGILFLFLIPVSIGFLLIHSQFPGKNWEVVNCDVGQGDGLVINLDGGQGILIDVGPDDKKIDSCLTTLGIKSMPLLVLTHFHADHVGGLRGALKNRNVGQVWLTSYAAPMIEHELTLSLLKGQREFFPTAGQNIHFNSGKGQVNIKVLWPQQTFSNYEQLPGDGSSINNSSIALLLDVNGLKIFATGDIEPPVQEEIYRLENFGAVDILKVPHHGSAYQFPDLLARVHPKISLISVGVGNRYGHPSQKTIALLERGGSKVMRTDLDGAIAVDPSLSIRTKKSDWWDISWG